MLFLQIRCVEPIHYEENYEVTANLPRLKSKYTTQITVI